MRRRTFLAAALVAAVVACTQVNQELAPSPVTVNLTTSGETAPIDPPVGPLGTITLTPPQFTVAVGSNVNVTVTVKDAAGQEKTPENITVSVLDPTIVSLGEIDGRIILFGGVAVGTTNIIVTASGLQAGTTGTVIP